MLPKLRQFPKANAPDDVPCSRIVLFWLSHNLYRSWGRGWRDVIGLPAHIQQLNLFLWAIERAREANVPVWLETVLKKDVPGMVPAGYRLWIPLNDGDFGAFVAACGAALPLVPAKRWRGEPIGSGNIGSLSQASAAIRVHSATSSIVEVNPVMPGRVPDSHLLSHVEAQKHFRSEVVESCNDNQSCFEAYFKNGCLGVPTGLKGLIHSLDHRVLCETDALLLYTLPLDSGELSTQMIAQLCENATGRSLPVLADPTDYGDIEIEEHRVEDTALERLLAEIYPTITKVFCTWKERLAAGADLSHFLEDINVLFSIPTPGVPRVYADTLAEMQRRLKALRQKSPTSVLEFASKIFFREPAENMTTLGNLLATVSAGLWVGCHLKPTQRKLFYGLYARAAGRVMANRASGGGLFIATGPAETGKSVAMQLFLSCMPNSLQNVSDGRSERAFTAKNGGDFDPDLKVEVWDELTSLLGETSAVKSQQTQLSNGCIRTERLIKNPDTGQYELQSTATARRTLTVAGTNTLHAVSAPIQSRAVIVSVPALKPRHGEHTMSTFAAMSNESVMADLKAGFVYFCQTISSLQARYWSLEAAGGIPRAKDQLLLVFKVICNTLPGGPEIAARKMNEVRNMAESLMVMDVTSAWYRGGEGAKHGFNEKEELKYYRANTILKMEYILAAVHTILVTTSICRELGVIQDTLRQLIHLDAFHNPEISPCGNYYVLITSRQKLADDVARANPTLGAGLAKTILSKIMQSYTNGQANIRFEPHSTQSRESVLLNRKYIAQAMGSTETAILDYLTTKLDKALPSWCEDYYVFKAGLRQLVSDPWDSDKETDLTNIAKPHYNLGLTLLGDRMTKSGQPAFFMPQTYNAARYCHPDQAGASASVRDKTKGKVSFAIMQPLVVHRSLFTELQQGSEMLTPELRTIFRTALTVAGGYDKKTIVLGVHGTGPSTVHSFEHTDCTDPITVINPMYVDSSQIANLFGELIQQKEDPVFPHSKKNLKWDATSNLEQVLAYSS